MWKSVALISLSLVGTVTNTIPAPQKPVCHEHVALDESDNGSSVCVAVHGDVTLMLKTANGTSWSTPTVTGHVLGPGLGLPTPFGLVGWQFRVNAAGKTAIETTSSHGVAYRVRVTGEG